MTFLHKNLLDSSTRLILLHEITCKSSLEIILQQKMWFKKNTTGKMFGTIFQFEEHKTDLLIKIQLVYATFDKVQFHVASSKEKPNLCTKWRTTFCGSKLLFIYYKKIILEDESAQQNSPKENTVLNTMSRTTGVRGQH